MPEIKAIQTSYKGYRFRSRLEARWAVFFDTLGLRWEYESEGFDLGGGEWYLPDFFIHDWRCFIEIKPDPPGRGYLLKPVAFAWRDGGNDTMLIIGNPWPGEHSVERLNSDGTRDEWSVFMECRRCSGVCLALFQDGEIHGYANIGEHTCEDHDKMPAIFSRGYAAARKADFKNGGAI